MPGVEARECRGKGAPTYVLESKQSPMNSDVQKLIDLQEVDSRMSALRAEIAALPKEVALIEAKLAGSKAAVEKAQNGIKADDTARRKHDVRASIGVRPEPKLLLAGRPRSSKAMGFDDQQPADRAPVTMKTRSDTSRPRSGAQGWGT